LDELLSAVLDAHGGLVNWQRARTVTAQLSLGGPFWAAPGWPDLLANETVTLDAHRQHIEYTPYLAEDRTSVFDVDPEGVAIRNGDGHVIEERARPRDSFPSEFDPLATRWDAIQVAYFASAAMWNYLTEPFVFTYPGVQTREIDPWDEDGETWRRLAVTFPPSNANHNPDQVFYYDERFMQRRMDYSPHVTGSPPIAHYTHDPKTFDGFVFPTRRLVHRRDADGVADQSFAAITIEIDTIGLERSR
jgi:hypothetical protein